MHIVCVVKRLEAGDGDIDQVTLLAMAAGEKRRRSMDWLLNKQSARAGVIFNSN